jgi:PAT family beta-lactamase induction signal transducer AmpG
VIDLRRSRAFRFFLFGALYFAQGVPWGFVTVVLPIQLAGKVDQETLSGIVAISYLPWTFKFIAGPVIDRFTIRVLGRRRPWILLAEAGMVATLLGLTGVDAVTAWPVFIGFIFAHNACAALQDVAVDALAVDTLEEHERGTANSIMFGCKYAGNAVGGAPLSWLARTYGLDRALVAQAGVLAAIWVLVWLTRERADAAAGAGAKGAPELTWRELGRELKRSFALRSTAVGALFMLVAMVGAGLTGTILIPMLKLEMGWTDGQIELAQGGIAITAGTLGAFAGGVVSDWLGRRRTIALAAAFSAACYAAFMIPALRASAGTVQGWMVLTNFGEGLLQTALLAMCMDLANPRVGGTQFTAYMSLSNMNSTLSTWAGGQFATAWGRLPVFGVAAAAQIVALLPLLWIDPHGTSARFRGESAEPPGPEKTAGEAATS